jgi:hypothetical protein
MAIDEALALHEQLEAYANLIGKLFICRLWH